MFICHTHPFGVLEKAGSLLYSLLGLGHSAFTLQHQILPPHGTAGLAVEHLLLGAAALGLCADRPGRNVTQPSTLPVSVASTARG